MVYTGPLISKSSNLCINPLVSVTRAPTTTDITDNIMFHILFSLLGRPEYLSFFSISFNFTSVVSWGSKVHNSARSLVFFFLFFLLIITWSEHQADYKVIRLHLRIPEVVMQLFFSGKISGCSYTIFSYCQI